MGGEGGLTLGICPLLTSGAGLDKAGTEFGAGIGPEGVSAVGEVFTVTVVVLTDAPVLEL